MPFYVKGEKIYHYLNAFGLTLWMCLHLFYIMILYLYTWMTGYGYADAALPACEALFDHLSWVELIIKKKDTVMWSLLAFVNDIERKLQHVITKAKRDTSLYPSLYKNYFCVIRISPLVVVTPHSYSELFAPCGISILPLCVFAEKL